MTKVAEWHDGDGKLVARAKARSWKVNAGLASYINIRVRVTGPVQAAQVAEAKNPILRVLLWVLHVFNVRVPYSAGSIHVDGGFYATDGINPYSDSCSGSDQPAPFKVGGKTSCTTLGDQRGSIFSNFYGKGGFIDADVTVRGVSKTVSDSTGSP